MLADLLHRIRRGIWRVIAGPYSTRNVSAARCMDCGKHLTADEREHYEVNCERCEAYSPYAQLDPHSDGVLGTQEPKEHRDA